MTPIDDCDYTCANCQRVVCTDNEPDCGHDDEPTCDTCCPRLHADELIREALKDWGRGEVA